MQPNYRSRSAGRSPALRDRDDRKNKGPETRPLGEKVKNAARIVELDQNSRRNANWIWRPLPSETVSVMDPAVELTAVPSNTIGFGLLKFV